MKSILSTLLQDKAEKKPETKIMNDVVVQHVAQTAPTTPQSHKSPAPPPPPPTTTSSEKDTSGHVIKTDPRYRKPFQFGWRREVVFRANLEKVQKSDNRGEVYYHSPSGKKLRTKSDIVAELRALKVQNLDIGDFTFAKESVGMPPDQEIVRSAKVQTPSQKRQSLALPEPIQPPEVLGKRIPKPKMPKGASPPPLSMGNKSRVSRKLFPNVDAIDSLIKILLWKFKNKTKQSKLGHQNRAMNMINKTKI